MHGALILPPYLPPIVNFDITVMTIIHTPRVIASVIRGLRQRPSATQQQTKHVGLEPGHPHVYHARAGIFDIDYLGHLNNAAFLNHAEYARWEMTAANGLLQAMYKEDTHYMVSSVSCRYRAQVRPLFRNFVVQTSVCGIDDRSIWMYQAFRYPKKGDDRVRAQVLVKGITVKKGKVIDPRTFLIESAGFEADLVETWYRPNTDSSVEDMITHFEELEKSYRHAAELDDEKRK